MSSTKEKLESLDEVEKNIISALESAAKVLYEFTRDNPRATQVDNHSKTFLKTLNKVETEISKNINNFSEVSAGQSHEGSNYGKQQVLQMASQRCDYMKLELEERQEKNSVSEDVEIILQDIDTRNSQPAEAKIDEHEATLKIIDYLSKRK